MPRVRINPDSANFPYLKTAGVYGPGQQNPADVELIKFETFAQKAAESDGKGPGYDRNCEQDGYFVFTFKVISEEMGSVTVREHQAASVNSGSKAWSWLNVLSVPMEEVSNPETGDIEYEFDDTQVAPRKCAIEVTDPRRDKNDAEKFYTGRVKAVLPVEG